MSVIEFSKFQCHSWAVYGARAQFLDQVKYLGVWINASLKDDDDIQRQVKSLYCAANKLRGTFDQCSTAVKNTLFPAYCMPMYACQLWSKYTQTSMKRLHAAYNNAYQITHYITRNLSVHPHQVSHCVRTFDAVLRNNLYWFFIWCTSSSNFFVLSLQMSDALYKSSFFLNWFIFPQMVRLNNFAPPSVGHVLTPFL